MILKCAGISLDDVCQYRREKLPGGLLSLASPCVQFVKQALYIPSMSLEKGINALEAIFRDCLPGLLEVEVPLAAAFPKEGLICKKMTIFVL